MTVNLFRLVNDVRQGFELKRARGAFNGIRMVGVWLHSMLAAALLILAGPFHFLPA